MHIVMIQLFVSYRVGCVHSINTRRMPLSRDVVYTTDETWYK